MYQTNDKPGNKNTQNCEYEFMNFKSIVNCLFKINFNTFNNFHDLIFMGGKSVTF